jgi:AbrB family looped-hinge helix DNA binding protein
MRVTEKGQVTIPKHIRDKLGIVPGSEVEFVEDGKDVRVVRANGRRSSRGIEDFKGWLESVRGLADTHGMDGKAYIDWLRGPRDDLDAG